MRTISVILLSGPKTQSGIRFSQAVLDAVQLQIKKKDSFRQGIHTLFELREQLMKTLLSFREELTRDDFNAIPFMNADGYHSKTIAYSIWHIFRIEDIVAHTLINKDEQIFFSSDYRERINSPIITTGNELVKMEIADFSEQLDLDELYNYAADVMKSTNDILDDMSFDMLRTKITSEQKEQLKALNVVSDDENAVWLVDYWCEKDVSGLVRMPFSRHWIMHIEASIRIRDRLKK